MRQLHKKIRSHHVISLFALGGFLLAASYSPAKLPLFSNIDNFVLFGSEGVTLEEGTQISSGDVGSNKTIHIDKDAIINGNLFADRIELGKNTTINGNASFNTIKKEKDSQILGTTSPATLPIFNLSQIPNFPIGTQDKTFQGTSTSNTLNPGNYKTITIEENSSLTLTPGTYNITDLVLKDGAMLIYEGTTTINIKERFKIKDKTSILANANISPQLLTINYQRSNQKREDDDGEIKSESDPQDLSDYQQNKEGRPIVFGQQTFLNFKLLAPRVTVVIGKNSTMTGQVVGRKVRVKNKVVLSKRTDFAKESDISKIVQDQDGNRFISNEIIILFKDGSSFADALAVANSVQGNITGFVPFPVIYKIEAKTTSAIELKSLIDLIKTSDNPLILEVVPNLIGEITQ